MTATREAGNERDVVIYTDGACRGNPGLGAFAAILTWKGKEKEIYGVVEDTTNNRMELSAAIHALEALRRPSRVRIVTDSQYVHNGMTRWLERWRLGGWRTAAKAEVRNRDLWEKLADLCARHEVEWQWVAGHAGHELNERCDQLANRAMDEYIARRG